jgi:hypothetical protein
MSRAGSEVRGTSSLNEQLYTGVTGPKGAEKPPSEAPHRERPGKRIGWRRGEGKKGRREGRRYGSRSVSTSNRALVGRRYPPATGGEFGGSGSLFAAPAGGGFVRGTRLRIPVPTTVRCPVRSVRRKRAGRSRCGLYVARRAGTGRLRQIVQATAERTQRSSPFLLPTEKIYRTTGLSPHNTGKLYRPTRCRGLTTNRFPHRSPVEVKSGRRSRRIPWLHTGKSP